MNQIIEKLYGIKYQSEEEIIETIENVLSRLASSVNISKEIHFFLDSRLIKTNLEDKDVLFGILLSFVLDASATQLDPHLKEQNIAKIKSISEKKNIDFLLVTELARVGYETKLTELISSHLL